jgi:hypothetical protein
MSKENPTDEEVVEQITRTVRKAYQGPLRTGLGDEVAAAVELAIRSERERCANIVATIQRQGGQARESAKGRGDKRVELLADGTVRACEAIFKAFRAPPGTCKTCLGEKQVRSVVAAMVGTQALVRCPDCA